MAREKRWRKEEKKEEELVWSVEVTFTPLSSFVTSALFTVTLLELELEYVSFLLNTTPFFSPIPSTTTSSTSITSSNEGRKEEGGKRGRGAFPDAASNLD